MKFYTKLTFGIFINVNVTLNPAKFVGGSQEFIAAIYHECFHAIMNFLTNNTVPSDDQHIAMFTNYLNLLANSLQAVYPNLQQGDAKGLILFGLLALDGGISPGIGKWATEFVDKVLNHSGFSRTQINTIYSRHQIYHISGTPCN